MILVPVIVLGCILIINEYMAFENESRAVREGYIKDQESIVRHEVMRAVGYLKWQQSKETIPEEKFQQAILAWFSTIRFQNRGREPGILFVRSYDGILMMSVSKPELIGKDISKKLDPNGINTHQQFMTAVENPDGGFVDYSWFNPITQKIAPKRTFVMGVPDYGWYVGAGFWFDDIESVIVEKRAEMKSRIERYFFLILLILTTLLVVQFLFSRYITQKIHAGFEIFSVFFNKAATDLIAMDLDEFQFSEFSDLAVSANQMLAERKKAEDALRESEKRHRSILENIEEGYCEVDPNGGILFFNDSMCRILGYSRNELEGKNSADILEEIDRRPVFKTFADVFNSERPRSEYTLKVIRKDGTTRQIEISISLVRNASDEKTGLRMVVRDVERRKQYEERLIYHAYHDALTGLNNRKSFYERLEGILTAAQRYSLEIALIYVDVDNFKKVNDSFGHEAGDELLIKITQRLKTCLRKTDFISRIGGDEFVIILDNPQQIQPAVVAQKIVDALSEPYSLEDERVDYISASVGVSMYPADATDMNSLVSKADSAMYRAKQAGNGYSFSNA